MQTLRLYLLLTTWFLSHFTYAQTQFLTLEPPFYRLDALSLMSVNLDVLNPVYDILGDKSRKTTEQEWNNNAWLSKFALVTTFSPNCDKPIRRVRSAYNLQTSVLEDVGLDTFIYVNNKLSNYKRYYLGRLVEQYQFVYNGTRNTPDTVWASTFTELMRYSYTYSGNQMTAIAEDVFVSTSVFPNRRVKITYTPNGRLQQYLTEKIDSGIWKKNSDYSYAYDSSNRLKKYTRFEAPYPSITEGIYAYNAQNQVIELGLSLKLDTLPPVGIFKFLYSDYTSKNRPRQVGFYLLQGVTSQALAFLYTYAYETNDSMLNKLLVKVPSGQGALVNSSQTIYEACGSPLMTIEKRREDVSINVFPNPTNAVIYTKMNDFPNALFDVSIANASGQVLQELEGVSSDIPLSIKDLPNGVYFIRLISNQKIGVTSFVIAR